MSVYRYMIDLAVPRPLPAFFDTKPTPAEITWITNHTWIEIIREAVIRLKNYSSKINNGVNLEEDTTKAKYHVCHHDEVPQLPCEPEEDI